MTKTTRIHAKILLTNKEFDSLTMEVTDILEAPYALDVRRKNQLVLY